MSEYLKATRTRCDVKVSHLRISERYGYITGRVHLGWDSIPFITEKWHADTGRVFHPFKQYEDQPYDLILE